MRYIYLVIIVEMVVRIKPTHARTETNTYTYLSFYCCCIYAIFIRMREPPNPKKKGTIFFFSSRKKLPKTFFLSCSIWREREREIDTSFMCLFGSHAHSNQNSYHRVLYIKNIFVSNHLTILLSMLTATTTTTTMEPYTKWIPLGSFHSAYFLFSPILTALYTFRFNIESYVYIKFIVIMSLRFGLRLLYIVCCLFRWLVGWLFGVFFIHIYWSLSFHFFVVFFFLFFFFFCFTILSLLCVCTIIWHSSEIETLLSGAYTCRKMCFRKCFDATVAAVVVHDEKKMK